MVLASDSTRTVWFGGNGRPLDAVNIRILKMHLPTGNLAVLPNGGEYVILPGAGAKHPNTTKTGVVLTVKVENCTSPLGRQVIEEHGRLFSTRAPYLRKTLFT